jgi:hypothetical protein
VTTHCLQLSLARSATRLTTISISLSGFPGPLGKTNWLGVALVPLSISSADQAGRQGNHALLPVLRREAPVGLRLYPYIVVAEVDVLPLDATDLLVAEAGAEHELEQRRFAARNIASSSSGFQFAFGNERDWFAVSRYSKEFPNPQCSFEEVWPQFPFSLARKR